MTDFETLLKGCVKARIQFVLVGGLAAVIHGATSVTNDLDLVYARTQENVRHLVAYLRSLKATLRGAPEDLPFQLDESTFGFGMNFTFHTTLGDVDLLGEIAGLGAYPQVLKFAEPLDLYGTRIDVLSIEGLLRTKRAANRPKDQMHLHELEALSALKR